MSLRLTLLYKAATLYWALFKPITLGVKALLVRDNAVLLVKHSYQPGWFLPGGGVKRKETLEAAVRREAREEVHGKIGDLRLFGVYSAISEMKNDHVIVMLSHDFVFEGPNDREITEAKLFPMTALPSDVSSGTYNRIQEYLSDKRPPHMADW